jgi:hypothetical protein
MDTQQKVWYDILRIGDDRGTRRKSIMENTEASRINSVLSLYPKIFDYSLGGYYHREDWARTW